MSRVVQFISSSGERRVGAVRDDQVLDLTAAHGWQSTRDIFQAAIDRAAMRAGKGSSELYLAEWRRDTRRCENDLRHEASSEVEKLNSQYSNEVLEQMVKSKGYAVESETSNR